MNQILLTLQDLSKYYTTEQSVTVGLSHIDLAFQRGEFVAITGESGSGKSTLAHVLGGILRYEGGELLYGGKPTSHYDSADWERYRRDKVSFISQSYGILPGSSVLDNVTCALRLVGISKEQAQKKAEEILKKVELWDLRYRRAAKLSSGQKQRLSIARALAKPAPVLIADEPTGNLDAENSAMVISLLAEAARDRLVILITHEFSEAADYVTRHIELHDGRVTMDARLREVPELPAVPKTVKTEGKKGLSWFVSRFQIKARPVWAALMLCLFAFTVFAMFAISGTFISNLDDTFTYYYDNSAFRNGDTRRIVVARPDGGEFTPEDIEKILSVRYVDSVEEWGYVTDIQYAYREGVDYEIQNNLEAVGLFEYVATSNYSVARMQKNMLFARTVPTLPDGKEFLTAGRLPENLYEVVAVGGEEMLGQEITVLVQDQKNWGGSSFIRMEVTVVGVTDYGSHLYFHEDLGKIMVMNTRDDLQALLMPLPEGSVVVGKEQNQASGDGRGKWAFYKTIGDGLVGKEDELLDMARQQAGDMITRSMEEIDKFIAAFSMEKRYGSIDHFVFLRRLAQYAAVWEIENELLEVMDEVGWGEEAVFSAPDGASWQNVIINAFPKDQETEERVASAGNSLFQRFKEVYEQKKAAVFAVDMADLDTQEKIEALMKDWWGAGSPYIYENYVSTTSVPAFMYDDWGQVPSMAFHPIQPGEVVISSTTQSILISSLKYEEVKTDADWDRAFKQAQFLTYRLPDMGGLETVAGQVDYKDFTALGITDMGNHWVALIHPDDFAAMTYPGKGGQISVFAEDYAYVDRVLEAIHAMGYGAISPYQEGAVNQNEELAAQRTQTLRVCIIALLAVIALQILLLRAMFSMETESYRLLSHIGLNGVTAQRSVLWQIMLFALGGQVLGVGLILACAMRGMDQVVKILRYLPLSYRLVLCAVHLGASAFTALWTMKALKKQVFPESGAEPDLDWDVVGEEVEA